MYQKLNETPSATIKNDVIKRGIVSRIGSFLTKTSSEGLL